MRPRPRGRPKGSVGRSLTLTSDQIKAAIRAARRERYSDRAILMLALSMELGLRATELASLKWADIYNNKGGVLGMIAVRRAYGGSAKIYFDVTALPKLRRKLADYYEKQRGSTGWSNEDRLFRSQRGKAMTATSVARYLTGLYRKAGIPMGTSRSGRRTREGRLAQSL